ncbi:MAG: DNA gyrase subunit A [Roseibium album]|uniref:DNA gyrase subunit A n=1 Tax=Roseibium album TaxID=311410 RepID=UPI000CF1C051|nr:DNA gyrase subunit A [Labrenzia sp. EL_142]MBG6156190.1 DNA gyrase subunit A [Labrenzia sp. EL_162]MBG6163981.1 DNA gyrase subunit A [Labrenzia sp. EL_195]MBG6194723.1 DNA gyrase subunit A [Labrenzia sp. EL_159]MBG6200346.1 DNA gyrase subunit A [Labrenzia sp. EL_13]
MSSSLADQDNSTPSDGLPSDIKPVSIVDEMKRSYLDYAMSVIVSRALPDVRDGLKPVHRRILYSMHENGYEWNKPYRKSARVVGDVMGKYHPHGDSAIYDALVRMAQNFSLRLPLIDGQGNFGSVDGDPAAAMRYTECRLEKVAHKLLDDIDKETVDFQENYDNSESEPVVIPAKFPNLLVNGAGGIAVGMATNIPPHNLGEVIDAAIAIMENPAMTLMELMEIVPGPDFPTGGMILGRAGIRNAYETGRGSIVMRAKVDIEEVRKDRNALIVSEIPYQVNKSTMIEKIAELVRDKRVEGISDIRDESDRSGMRVVIELKRDAVPDVVLNQLYRFSQLQTSFGANMVALNGGKPEQMNLSDMLTAFVAFREEVVQRRTRYLLKKARDRAHILVGLGIAVANIDEVIHLIRTAPDPATARAQLMERDWPARDVEPLIRLIDDPRHQVREDGTYKLSEEQARAILDLRLQRLTALGRDEIDDELKKIGGEISDFLDILRSRARIQEIVRNEMLEIKEEFATPRRTEIVEGGADFDDEDLIQREDMVVTVSHSGYIKRVPLATYRAQRRGGKGRAGMATKDEDFVTRLFVANTHTPVLFFSSRGICYKMKVWRLPLGGPTSRGKALVNMLPLEQGEQITSILPLPEDEDSWANLDVMFATVRGTVRRNKLSDFVNINRNGKIAMKLEDGDGIVGVDTCSEHDDVMLTTNSGQCIRFATTDVRVFAGRNSVGVRGIRLADEDRVISMQILHHIDVDAEERAAYLKLSRAMRGEADESGSGADEEGVVAGDLPQERYAQMSAAEQIILTVSENGYGKRTSSFEYRVTGRGGKGITAMAVNDRNGGLIASFPVEDSHQIMLVTDGGQLIRCPVDGIRIAGRATQGVIVFKTATEEKVVAVEGISEVDDDEDLDEEGEVTDGDNSDQGSDGDPSAAAPDGDS